jgi:membrane protein DedA with SNARE-associated domain
MSMHVIRVHYFVCVLRLIFLVIFEYCSSGSLMRAEVLLIMSVVLLYRGMSEYHVAVAVATAGTTLDVA